jgi:hypothetical protein
MNRKTLAVLLGALVVALAATTAAVAASIGPAVTVQIKTLTKTLRTATVHGQTGWITKGGTPKGKCSGDSAAGALGEATHGKWTASYDSQYKDVLVTSILGVKPKNTHYYWELFVNGKSASVGVCQIKPKAHETILFKIARA